MDLDPNKFIGSITFADLTLWILGFGGLVGILDYVGLLPSGLAKWLARNRMETTLQALKRLGVRIQWNDDHKTLSIIQRTLHTLKSSEHAYIVHLRQLLEEDTFESSVNIGGTRSFASDRFIDVMGGVTNPVRATAYAKILKTHAALESIRDFDVVATPRTGSVILGYEFAKLTAKPLVLGVMEKAQDQGGAMEEHAVLDFSRSLSLQGKKVILVDDSTTGGRKLVDLASELRKGGATVEGALILFEPQGKGARQVLKNIDIELHSIIEGPHGRF